MSLSNLALSWQKSWQAQLNLHGHAPNGVLVLKIWCWPRVTIILPAPQSLGSPFKLSRGTKLCTKSPLNVYFWFANWEMDSETTLFTILTMIRLSIWEHAALYPICNELDSVQQYSSVIY